MPLPGTPDTARVGVLFTFGADGNQCENTFHLQDLTRAMFSDPIATCNTLLTAINASLHDGLSPAVSLTGVTFEDVSTFPFGGVTVGQTPIPGGRTGSTQKLPSSCALAIRKSTDNLGRSGRGRWYWPLGDTFVLGATNDTVDATSIGIFVGSLANLQSAIETALSPAVMGVVSYRNGGVQRTEGLFQPILGWSVADAIVDNQRRRLTGRGR